MNNKIICGDCLGVMKTFSENSVDAIVCDPPYGLSAAKNSGKTSKGGFMGKKWDYDVPSQEIWEECLRVLKPGGYLLAFAGTRTQHRMAVRIEDAGFEIRDMIAYVYGSGFPKSLNIGKAVDKIQGNERKDLGEHPNARDTVGNINICKKNGSGRLTKGTSEWEGWGTALKPALEPITVARKPIEKGLNVAQNCLKWGVGGINIDGCRVATNEDMSGIKAFGSMPENKSDNKGFSRPWMNDRQSILDKQNAAIDKMKTSGRFPANLIHDGSDEVVGLFPQTKSPKQYNKKKAGWLVPGSTHEVNELQSREFGDSGSAARFFYCAKASKSERNRGCEELQEVQKFWHNNEGRDMTNPKNYIGGKVNIQLAKNHHPTVKPIALMEYLVKLVSKEGHTVLDPFMGSGSTGIACKKLGREFIGIELDADYCKIAEARINAVKKEPEQLTI